MKIRDIATFAGVRENMLVGYGLVVGLNGSGDDMTASPYTQESLKSMLNRLGVNAHDKALGTTNVAAVMVTAKLPAFARAGNRIDVTVSAIGGAKSLLGGTLLVTPLIGADNQVYAVAQGSLVVGGFSASGKSSSNVSKNIPTNGSVPNGGIVERDMKFSFAENGKTRISLANTDFATANLVTSTLNKKFGPETALILDKNTIEVAVPNRFKDSPYTFFAELEQTSVLPDQVARVVINEQDGVIVMGQDVRISTVAVNHGNLVISVTEETDVSQPNAASTVGSQATTQTTEDTSIDVSEDTSKMVMLKSNATLRDLVNAFNALGVSVRDMITIIRTIKSAGAIHAELEVL